MPALIDMHVHLGPQTYKANEEPGILEMPKLVFDWVRFYPDTRRAFLENGVTTVRDLGNEHGWIMELRQQLQDGSLEGPRLFAAGPVFTTLGGHPVATFGVDPASDSVRLPKTPEEARSAVRELASGEDRVDLIKVVQERGRPGRGLEPIAPEILDAIVTEAHEQGLAVTAHWGSLEDLEDVIAAGVDGLEHVEARAVLDGWPEGVLDRLLERNAPIAPTLAVADAALPPQISSQLRLRVGELYAAGGRIIVGSDAPINGVLFGAGVHRELELLVDCGLTPKEALRAATSESARALRTGYIGAIEPGRSADLLVVDGDPLQDIKDAQNVVMVFRDGRRVVDCQSTG
jgi:enamidase